LRKCCEATFESADGVVILDYHPVRAILTLLMARPPLLFLGED